MNENVTVLIVDDDATFRNVLKRELGEMGFKVQSSSSAEEALEILTTMRPDVVLLDMRMPRLQGDDAIPEIKKLSPWTEIIILTGFATVDSAIKCIKTGAYDYLTKPCKLDELEVVIWRAVERKNILRENTMLKKELGRSGIYNKVIGESEKIREILDMVARVATTDSTVLLQGESGTGKELIARAIHNLSNRKTKPFIVVDCTSLHENLLLSELFGHEKGSFTGANELKRGLFEVADSGTILLDEIGDITPAVQAKLLRVLETSTFRRVGGTKDINVDVRIIATTNRPLKDMVNKRLFRDDLYFRLNIFAIYLPPLRERRDDIPKLVRHFIQHRSMPVGPVKEISDETMRLLCEYSWPGNIRELKNVLERALILSQNTPAILPEHLPPELKSKADLEDEQGKHPTLREVEQRYIKEILNNTHHNKREAAKILDMSERNLYRLIGKYKLL